MAQKAEDKIYSITEPHAVGNSNHGNETEGGSSDDKKEQTEDEKCNGEVQTHGDHVEAAEGTSDTGSAQLHRSTDDLHTASEQELTILKEKRKCVRCCCPHGHKFRRCKKYWQPLLLTVVVLLYAMVGGFLFSHLESSREHSYNTKVEKWKNDTAILLATELRKVTPYEEVWARRVYYYMDLFEQDLLLASYKGYRRPDDPSRGQMWTFKSALFFSISLMTSTGCGSATLHSEWSRTAILSYSALGIPLTALWLIVVGSSLATLWSWLFARLCCRFCRRTDNRIHPYPSDISGHPSTLTEQYIVGSQLLGTLENVNTPRLCENKANSTLTDIPLLNNCYTQGEPSEIYPNAHTFESKLGHYHHHHHHHQVETTWSYRTLSTDDHIVTIVFSAVLFIVYFVFGSTAVAVSEEWTISDSVYFNFVMFTTIGPGLELEAGIPTPQRRAPLIRENISYLFFLLFGFCLISMFLNLIYNFCVRKRMKRMMRRKRWSPLQINYPSSVPPI